MGVLGASNRVSLLLVLHLFFLHSAVTLKFFKNLSWVVWVFKYWEILLALAFLNHWGSLEWSLPCSQSLLKCERSISLTPHSTSGHPYYRTSLISGIFFCLSLTTVEVKDSTFNCQLPVRSAAGRVGRGSATWAIYEVSPCPGAVTHFRWYRGYFVIIHSHDSNRANIQSKGQVPFSCSLLITTAKKKKKLFCVLAFWLFVGRTFVLFFCHWWLSLKLILRSIDNT